MTEVLHFPPPQTANNSSSGDVDEPTLSCAPQTSLTCAHGDPVGGGGGEVKKRDKQEGDQLSLLALLVTFFRKSLTACRSSSDNRTELCATMDIGCPTDVRHVAHVTFDRFHGFLGLPVEFEPEVPRRAPSASATVFGVSTESMQLSYDTRGNSVPTILLLMQRRLYAQAGLQAEGIFRINGENSLEEYVREQLNGGVVPEGIDAHCLAGLIKAWFRELPSGVLDSLNSEQVMQCQTEEQCAELVRLLPPTEYALLDWAINLMADVVQQEHLNKMNARNIAMVFAPNMTQMADPLTALMYAVQVMNFLKTLILRTLREREDSAVETTQASFLEPFDDDGDQRPSISCNRDAEKDNQEIEPAPPGFRNYSQNNETADGEGHGLIPSVGKRITDEDHYEETPPAIEAFISEKDATVTNDPNPGTLTYAGQSSDSSPGKVTSKITGQQSTVEITNPVDKTEGICNLSSIESRVERIEAWR